MFNSYISSPISPLTQSFLQKYERPEGDMDYSLSCLGVALLRSRVQNYRGICGKVGNAYATTIVQEVEQSYALRLNNQDCPAFFYYVCQLSDDTFAAFQKQVKSWGMTELTQVETFVKQETGLSNYCLFISPETNAAFVVAPSNSIGLYHLTQAFLYALYPRIFKDNPLDKDEIQILKALTQNSSNKYISLLAERLSPLRASILKQELSKWFMGFKESKIRTAEANIESIRNSINSYLSQYRNLMDQLDEAIVKYEGLKALNSGENSEAENELAEYISTNPCLHDISYSNGCLVYVVTTQLTNFDMMKFRNAVRNYDIYNHYTLESNNPFFNVASRKLLLNALFNNEDPELTVNMIGKIYLQLTRSYMEVDHGDVEIAGEHKYITNPHYKYHGCPGRNRDQIIQCLDHGDLIQAIECSIAGVGSVNIGETEYTFRRMVQEIFVSKDKIIHRYDGVDMTPAEALLWLAKREGDNAA